MRRTSTAIVVVIALAASQPAIAKHADPEIASPAGAKRAAILVSSISFADAPVLARLGRAVDDAPAELKRLTEWNREGRIPHETGFWRPLAAPLSERIARFTALSSTAAGARIERRSDGAEFWHGRVTIASANGIRIHMTGVELPRGTRLWLRGATDTIGPIDPAAILWKSEIWCPTVRGESAELIVEVPRGGEARFDVDGAMEVVEPVGMSVDPPLQTDALSYRTCQKNAECYTSSDFDAIDLARGAVAEIEFISGPYLYICSGGLLADTDSSTTIPYFLTANHCVSTQGSASTVTAYFDHRWSDCAETSKSAGNQSHGATLLATSAYTDTSGPGTDVTLLRLADPIPSGRTYLGWNSSASVPDGTKLYRISHPNGDPQSYTTYTVQTPTDPNDPNQVCPEVPPTRFIYETTTLGSTYGGSSGSPVMIAGGYVVGQLFGECGVDNADPCTYTDFNEIDGRFSRSWTYVSQWLDPSTCVAPAVATSPGDRTIPYGSWTTLSVTKGGGSVPVTYQWYQGTTGDTSNPINGAISSSYTTPSLTVTTSYWVRIGNFCGHADSATATVTVSPCVPPSMTTQPQSTSIDYGRSATFTTAGSGSPTLTYHWYRGTSGDVSHPVGGNFPSYTTPALTVTTSYWVRITNPCGSADSGTVTVTVAACASPTITTQPVSQSMPYGRQARLTVGATGTAPITYQWFLGQSGDQSSPIAGAATTTLITPPITSTAEFWVLVGSACGSLPSATATITPTCDDPTIDSTSGTTRVQPGDTTTLSITASGTSPLTVQWYADGTAIPGATQLSYTTPALRKTTIYGVIVTGPCGTTAATDFSVVVIRLHPVRRP